MTHFSSFKAALYLFAFILIIYSNTFKSSWQLDDFPNIVDNHPVHLTHMSFDNLTRAGFAGSKPGRLYRPLPMISFALNWYFGGTSVVGYHVVNTCLHWLVALTLFHVLWLLFSTPALAATNREDRVFICLLSSILWAVNPLQTQAVTYIVQRMTVMATLFYLLSLYSFLRGRFASIRLHRWAWFSNAAFAYLLALLSKENVVFLPVVLLVVEIIFFRIPGKNERPIYSLNKGFLWGSICVSLLGGLSLIFLMKADPWGYILKLYADRPFTPMQRLFTQPRVVLFYVSQFFYPVPARLSIQHDFTISTSLIDPWTTLAAVLIIATAIAVSIKYIKKQPLLCYAILFFLINHIVESTILPISMVYEHRNYLPTLFLYVPVVAGIAKLKNYYSGRNGFMFSAIVGFVCLYLFVLGMGTYTRNFAWASQKSLWEDALRKAPQSAWPYQFVGDYYKYKGRYDIATKYYRQALSRHQNTVIRGEVTKLNNLAALALLQRDYRTALMWLNRLPEAQKKNPILYSYTHPNDLVAKLGIGDIQGALKDVEDYRAKGMYNSRTSYLHGIVYYRAGDFHRAMRALRAAMQYQPNNSLILATYARTLTRAGFPKRGERFYRLSFAAAPNDITAYLYWMEDHVKDKDRSATERTLTQMASRWSVNTILQKIDMMKNSPEVLPIDSKLLKKILCNQFLVLWKR